MVALEEVILVKLLIFTTRWQYMTEVSIPGLCSLCSSFYYTAQTYIHYINLYIEQRPIFCRSKQGRKTMRSEGESEKAAQHKPDSIAA